jgi:hypothetical protein
MTRQIGFLQFHVGSVWGLGDSGTVDQTAEEVFPLVENDHVICSWYFESDLAGILRKSYQVTFACNLL